MIFENMPCRDPVYQEFSDLCKKAGWKCTIQRFAVYRFIRHNTTHPSVEAVWKAVRQQIPAISTDSVHRILKDFTAIGILRQMDGLSCVRFDCNPTKHAHFVCLECNRILDIPNSHDLPLPDQCSHFGEVEGMEIRIVGRCRDCIEKSMQTAAMASPPAEVISA